MKKKEKKALYWYWNEALVRGVDTWITGSLKIASVLAFA
jgi:hypothetical protein